MKVHLKRFASGGYRGAIYDPKAGPYALCSENVKGPFADVPEEVTCKTCLANNDYRAYTAGWDAAFNHLNP